MGGRTRIEVLTRLKDAEGKTLVFKMAVKGRGRSASEFVYVNDVPPFEGDFATFEVEKVPGHPWPRWVAIRRVD